MKLYDNPELEYYSLSEKGFFVEAYGGNYTLAKEHDEQMKNAYFLFPAIIAIKSIKNQGALSSDSYIYVEMGQEEIFTSLKDSGYKDLNGKVFTVYQPGSTGFFLADVNTKEPISLHLEGEFLKNKVKLYIGVKNKAEYIQSRDPQIVFDHDIFNEELEGAEFHTGRCINIKGATHYNGEDFNFKLIEIDSENDKYTYGLYYVNDEDDINFVAYTYGYEVYDRLLKNNGNVYFYFDSIEKKYLEQFNRANHSIYN